MSSKKSKAAIRTTEQDTTLLARVGGVTVESALKSISTAQATIGRTLASVGEQTQKELQALEDVKRALVLEKAELEAVHGKNAMLSSLEELEANFALRAETLEKEHTAQVDALADKRDAISRENELSAEQEKLERAKQKMAAEAVLESEIHARRTVERDRTDALSKDWAAREAALAAREAELVTLKTNADAFPATLNAAVSKAEAIVGSTVKRDYEHKMQLIMKDAETAKQMADMQQKTQQETINRLQTQLTEAYTKLDQANTKVADIATKALDSASGQRTLTEMQSFAAQKDSGNGSAKRT